MQIKPEYEALDEFTDMATALAQKFPERFGNVDIAKIKAVVITNKDKPDDKNKVFDIVPVQMPIRMDCPFSYYIVLWMSHWAEQGEEYKLAIVAKALHAIPTDETKEGKVVPPDMKDYFSMVCTFGPNYLEKEKLPHLLRDKIEWVDN